MKITRRILALLLPALLLFGLLGCQSGPASASAPAASGDTTGEPDPQSREPDPTPVPDPEPQAAPYHLAADTDCDARLAHSGWHSLAETADACYGIHMSSHYLTVYDKAVGEAFPLCGRPECSHDNPLCDSYVNVQAHFLTVYEGRLYWYGHDPLYRFQSGADQTMGVWRMDLDGTNRTKVKNIPEDIWRQSTYDMLIHRGKIFLEQRIQTVTDGAPGTRLVVYQMPMELDAPLTALLDCSVEAGDLQIKAVGDWLYVMLFSSSGEEPPYLRSYRLLRFDLTTGQEETLWTWEDTYFVMSSLNGLYVDRNGTVMISGYEDLVGEVFRLSDGRVEPIMVFDDPELWTTAPMPMVTEDLVVCIGRMEDGTFIIWVRDTEGNTLYKGPWDRHYREFDPNEPVPPGSMFVGGERDYFIFYYLDTMADSEYFVRYDVTADGLTETVLWEETLGIWNP